MKLLKKARREVKTSTLMAKQIWLIAKVEAIESYSTDARKSWAAVRELNLMFESGTRKNVEIKMRKRDGTLSKTPEESAKVMADHCEKRYF